MEDKDVLDMNEDELEKELERQLLGTQVTVNEVGKSFSHCKFKRKYIQLKYHLFQSFVLINFFTFFGFIILDERLNNTKR